MSKSISCACSDFKTYEDPFYLQLHITDKCNLKCKHCYDDSCLINDKNILGSDEIFKILNQYQTFLKDIQMKGKIYFTGGEPIIDPNLCKYISKASELNLCTMVLSNGTLIDYFKALELREAGLNIVQISLDGLKNTHDQIRGIGNFDLALKGLENCHRVGLNTTVMTTLNRLNMNEIEEIIQTCIIHKVKRFSMGRLVPTGNGADLMDLFLNKRELLKVFKKLKRLKRKYSQYIHISIHDPLWLTFLKQRNSYGCSAGKRGICVIENGDIMPCRRLNLILGNIRNNTLSDIWNFSTMKHFHDRDNYKGKCKDCKYLKNCGGCRAIARAVKGSEFEEDPQCFIK